MYTCLESGLLDTRAGNCPLTAPIRKDNATLMTDLVNSHLERNRAYGNMNANQWMQVTLSASQSGHVERRRRRSLIRWLVVSIVILLLGAYFALPPLRPAPGPIGPLPTSLMVTLTDSQDMAVQSPWTFEATPAVLNLYLVMRTPEDGNYVGGCRITSGLIGTETTPRGTRYHLTFLRGTSVLLDANLVPECHRFYLTERDEWYRLGLAYQDSYFQGAYRANTRFTTAFRLATQLAWPPWE